MCSTNPDSTHHKICHSFRVYYMQIFKKYLFIYFWLCWVLVSVLGLSLVAVSGGHSSSWCAGLSLSWPLLWSTGSRHAGSVVVAHGPSCSAACGIFPDQGSNPWPLHWQADSQPLRHQGSPWPLFDFLANYVFKASECRCLILLLNLIYGQREKDLLPQANISLFSEVSHQKWYFDVAKYNLFKELSNMRSLCKW